MPLADSFQCTTNPHTVHILLGCVLKALAKTLKSEHLRMHAQKPTGNESTQTINKNKVEMWANAQRDGRPAEYRWRPLFNAAVWLCSNATKTRNPLKFAGVPQTNETISAASGPKFTIL